jgi:hypothetical protein
MNLIQVMLEGATGVAATVANLQKRFPDLNL